jgi:RNA polymerase sigma factor (TIGR02999 family)
MRRILIGRARQKAALKAGGEWNRVELLSHELPDVRNEFDLIALDDTLQKLEVQDRRAANLVKLRFFGGLTMAEAAATLGVSVGTAENDWAYAKSWLKRQLRRSREGSRTN